MFVSHERQTKGLLLNYKIKLIIVDTDNGGFREIYEGKQEDIDFLASLEPHCADEIFGYMDEIQKHLNLKKIKLLFRVNSLLDIEKFETCEAKHVIDLRLLGEKIADAIASRTIQGG